MNHPSSRTRGRRCLRPTGAAERLEPALPRDPRGEEAPDNGELGVAGVRGTLRALDGELILFGKRIQTKQDTGDRSRARIHRARVHVADDMLSIQDIMFGKFDRISTRVHVDYRA